MASLLSPGVVQYHEISRTSRFRTFLGEIMMFLWDYDVITGGFPKKLGISCDFGPFCLVKCIPINKLNVTIPVLLKTSFKYRFHPLGPHLPHPPSPTLLACTPLPFSTTPSPNNCPPTKVNWQLKIVNYFTCMRHFFRRWQWHPEVDLNWYPRISNPYCRDIQIRKCEWSQGYKITQTKLPIKNSKLFYMYVALLL